MYLIRIHLFRLIEIGSLFLIEFQSEQVFDSYLSFLSRYPIILYNKINEVMIKSPIIGFGFEVGEYSALLDLSKIPKENLVVNTELFFARILRMLGFVGLVYYIIIFFSIIDSIVS